MNNVTSITCTDFYIKEFSQISTILQRPFTVTHQCLISRLTANEYELVKSFFQKYNHQIFYLIINTDCDGVILVEESELVTKLKFTPEQIEEIMKIFSVWDECKWMCYAVDGFGFINIKTIKQTIPNIKSIDNQFHKLERLSSIIHKSQ